MSKRVQNNDFYLLKEFAMTMNCVSYKDLKGLLPFESGILADRINAEYVSNCASLKQWNKALMFLTNDNPEKSPDKARNDLIQELYLKANSNIIIRNNKHHN